MKLLYTGRIILDSFDLVCFSFSVSASLAFIYKKYYKGENTESVKNDDLLVDKLKKISPIIAISKNNKILKLPILRGGHEQVKVYFKILRNKRIIELLRRIVQAKHSEKQLKLLQIAFFLINQALSNTTGLKIAVGGNLVTLISNYPLLATLLLIELTLGRGVEVIKEDTYEKCRLYCKVSEQYHNKELLVQMKELKSITGKDQDMLKIPLDIDTPLPLLCTENKLSLTERFKLRKMIESKKSDNRVQHFSNFIKKFSECDSTPENVLEEVLRADERLSLKK